MSAIHRSRGKTDVSFDEVKRLASRTEDDDLIGDIDRIASIILLFSPAVGAGGVATAWGLLEGKGELTKLANSATRRIKGAMEDDKLTLHEAMSAAYALLPYSAFFEAFDSVLVKLRRKLSLKASERLALTERVVADLSAPASSPDGTDLNTFPIRLPHPTTTVDEQASQLTRLYLAMTERASIFTQGLAAWEQATEVKKDEVAVLISELPEASSRLFTDQYLRLCVEYNSFCVWSNLQEHELTREQFRNLRTEVRSVIELRTADQKSVDIGLSRLAALTHTLSALVESPASETLEDLQLLYNSNAKKPIIVDDYDEEGKISLVYPSKTEIFVPQSFRAIRYTPSVGPLENEHVWSTVKTDHSLGAFMVSHFESPHSITTPLIILGHPGSGKSLLTEILASRFSSSPYTPVRVELRDVNADSDIQNQIEEQLRSDTGRDTEWTDFSASAGDRRPLILLDGYDELLQASGRVFSTYLKKVAAFQAREATLNRPIRIIVTSRITLIDKAEVPADSTVVRLEEFDERRKSEWINRWNDANANYFADRALKPLRLPENTQIRALARQPLLLLMLALYDSQANDLDRSTDLQQTSLYNSLLRRFIDRERRKGEQGDEFSALSPSERTEALDNDMRRLGAAAIGMFNRQSLHIRKDELEVDIAWLRTGRHGTDTAPGRLLSQAELLLGSFFFVHESRSKVRSGEGVTKVDEGDQSFEFLHNTFGEFLTADFILDSVLAEASIVNDMSKVSNLHTALNERLDAEDGLPQTWFSNLMFSPIHSRPVIFNMLGAWAERRITRAELESDEFLVALDEVIYRQLSRCLAGRRLPAMLAGSQEHPYPKRGLIELVATYSLNLVVLRTAITGEWEFDEKRLSHTCDRPWERLHGLWRSGIGLASLSGVSRVICTRWDGSRRILERVDEHVGVEPHPLLQLHSTAMSMGDDVIGVLSGWAIQDVLPSSSVDLDTIVDLRATANLRMGAEIARRRAVRLIASRGREAVQADDPSWKHAGFSSSSLTLAPDTSRHASMLGLEGWHVASPVDFYLELTPEASLSAWRFFRGGLPGGRTGKKRAVRRFVLERAATAADVIASERSTGRSRRFDRMGGEVAEEAFRLANHRRVRLSVEVVLELVALDSSQLNDAVITKVLSGRTSPWSVASRSASTVRQVLALSDQRGIWGWEDRVLDALSGGGGQSIGPRLLVEMGMTSALEILAHAGERGALEGRRGLSGIVEWALGTLPVEDRLGSAAAVVRLLATGPSPVTTGIDVSDVLRAFEISTTTDTSAFNDSSTQELLKGLVQDHPALEWGLSI